MEATMMMDALPNTTADSILSSEENQRLAEELNAEMAEAALPVTVFVGIEACVGFFGNILILYVFLFRYHRCNFKYFVLCLSIIDLISCITTVSAEIVTQRFWYLYPYPMVCKIKSFFNVFTVCASAMTLLVIAVDRYRKVCHPFGWQVSHNWAKIQCLVLLIASFFIALPCPLFWGTQTAQVMHRGREVTVTICEKDGKYKATGEPKRYTLTIEGLISLHMVVMVVLYIFIAKQLFKDNAKENERKEKQKSIKAPRAVPDIVVISNEPRSAKHVLSDGYTSDDLDESGSASISLPPNSDCGSSAYVTPVPSFSDMCGKTQTKNKPSETKAVKKVTKKPRKKKQKTKRRSLKSVSSQEVSRRVRRKTLIMFILTAVFFITTVLYLTLLALISFDILPTLSPRGKATYFFFFRLYFINHVINPFLYGLLDAKFKRVMQEFKQKVTHTFASTAASSTTDF